MYRTVPAPGTQTVSHFHFLTVWKMVRYYWTVLNLFIYLWYRTTVPVLTFVFKKEKEKRWLKHTYVHTSISNVVPVRVLVPTVEIIRYSINIIDANIRMYQYCIVAVGEKKFDKILWVKRTKLKNKEEGRANIRYGIGTAPYHTGYSSTLAVH